VAGAHASKTSTPAPAWATLLGAWRLTALRLGQAVERGYDGLVAREAASVYVGGRTQSSQALR
jgi:hypothetical protein